MRLTRIMLLRGVSLALTVCAALGILIAPGPFTTPTISSAPLRPIAATDVNPLGATFFLDREVEGWKREQTVKMAKDAGIGWAKIMIAWQEIEPRKGRYYDDRYRKSSFEKFDEIVALLEKYGIRPIARLDKPPDWALAANGGDRGTPLRDISDYGGYVGEVAKHFKGHIQQYQIWNEPNLAAEWGNLPPNPAAYAALLKVASEGIRAADPDAVILSGPLAQTTERSDRAMPEVEYLDGLYAAGAGASFDILFANAYGFDKPPADPARPDVLNFQRVTLLRQKMVERGDQDKPIWLNEFGWNAAPASFPKAALTWGQVSEEQQAAYTTEAISLARSWDWLGVINLWYFRQVGDISPVDRADYYFRLVDVDFTPRLVYHALKSYAGTIRTAMPGVHQETSPAVELHGAWQHRRSDRAEGGGYVVSSLAGDSLTFDFNGDAVSLDSIGDGGRLQVKLDGADLPGLARDANGRATLSLPPNAATVPLVRGASAGHHILQLTVLDGPIGIDALTVEQGAVSYWPFYAQVAVVAAGVLGLTGSFFIRRRP